MPSLMQTLCHLGDSAPTDIGTPKSDLALLVTLPTPPASASDDPGMPMLQPRHILFALPLLASISLTATATAQCDPLAIANGPRTGCDGVIHAMTHWDPDGPGPLPPHLVVAGDFTEIATVKSGGLALYNEFTDTWSNLADADNTIECLAVDANGDLIVGGVFSLIGGVVAQSIAKFDGTTWTALGGGVTPLPLSGFAVKLIATRSNGDVIIAGSFSQVGGVPALTMARWNGTTWSAMGPAMFGPLPIQLKDMAVLPNDDLVVCGLFTSIGGVTATNIAKWDGSTWQAIAPIMAGPAGIIDNMDVMANGDLVCTGSFLSIAGLTANSVATWNGTSWSGQLAVLTGFGANNVTALANGNVVATGLFPNGSVSEWDGTQWQPLGNDEITDINVVTELNNGDLLAGGSFERIGISSATTSPGAGGLARWTNQEWVPEPHGVDGPVLDVLARGNGEYVVVGDFHNFAGISAQALAEHDGTGWTSYWVPPQFTRFTSVAELDNGNLILVGQGNSIYRSAGPIGGLWLANTNGPTIAIVDSNNDIIIGGAFTYLWLNNQPYYTSFAKYNTANGGWTTLDQSFTGTITAMAPLPGGAILVAGTLSSAATALGHLAIYDGGNWNTLAGNLNAAPTDITVLANGDIAAVGPFTLAGGFAANGVAIWNGTTWQAAGGGFAVAAPTEQPLACAALPDGGLLVGGNFSTAGSTAAANLAYWRGGSWHAVPTSIDGAVTAIDIADDGDIILGGEFLNVGGQPSAFAAQLEPICPATVATIGAPCQQWGSMLDLELTSAAWLGTSMDAVASNLPSGAITVAVYGLTTTNVPLSTLGIPTANCSLFVTPILTQTIAPTGPTMTTSLAIPAAAPLIGNTIHHQVVSLTVTPFASIASTQGISATIGTIW